MLFFLEKIQIKKGLKEFNKYSKKKIDYDTYYRYVKFYKDSLNISTKKSINFVFYQMERGKNSW